MGQVLQLIALLLWLLDFWPSEFGPVVNTCGNLNFVNDENVIFFSIKGFLIGGGYLIRLALKCVIFTMRLEWK